MRLPWRRGHIESATWLADDTLLASGWSLAPADALNASARSGGRTLALEMHAVGFSRPDLPDRPHPVGKVMIVRFPPGEAPRGQAVRLMIDGPGGAFATPAAALHRVTENVESVAAARLSWLDDATQARIIAALVELRDEQSPATLQLARSLQDIRRVLRARRRPPAAEAPSRLGFDRVLRIDERSCYLQGWANDINAGPKRLTAISPEGRRLELLSSAFRHPRPDLDRAAGPNPGFAAYVHVEEPSQAETGWTLELVDHDGVFREADAPAIVSDAAAVRQRILEDVRFDDPQDPRFVRDCAFPALQRVQELHAHPRPIREVLAYGQAPAQPDVSIVVPVFERIDFLEHQLAQFVDDPEVARADLIYVLDSPDLAQAFRDTARDLYSLYRIPFRVAVLERHLGFSPAINAGASIAHARLLLLLNSDVFPVQPGWLGRLQRFYDSTPRIGALGAKLLYEDDTVQHAGMYFERPTGFAFWRNTHYFKGFERDLPAANIARRVPAVTGACLMIARDVFQEQGQLRSCFVEGDYEDSDLCLRLSAAGRDNWYLPDVELYHLEGQSYRWEPRRMGSAFYNAWLHDRMWSTTIESVMTQQAAESSR